MDELMSFHRTEEVLAELADEFRMGYIKNLIKNGHFTYYGRDRLIDTITTQVDVDGHTFSASLNLNPYWEYLEYGTGPGRGRDKYWPKPSAIAKWIEVKPVVPRPDGNGRIPTPKQLTFLISRKIYEKGTRGTHDFERTQEEIIPTYIARIEEALSQDVGDYITALFTW